MFSKTKNILKTLLNFLYINKCLVCSKNAENFLCKNCKKQINSLSFYPIKIYKNVPIYATSVYDGTVKKLIKSLKFYRKKNASTPLASLLFSYFSKLEVKKDFVIVYPPTFFSKNIRRGYCHMDLICREFSKLTKFQIEKNLIKKIKYTKPQYKSHNRKKNIEDSFVVNKKLIEKYKNSSILLLDDITTSGATLEVLVDILKEAGIEDVFCLVVAKAG